MPLQGLWSASLDVGGAVPLGSAVLADDTAALVGTVTASSLVADRSRVRVVGGMGGMGSTVAATHYTAPTVSLVAGTILTSVGEVLSPILDPVASSTLTVWSTMADRASVALSTVCDAVSADWYARDDGTISIRAEGATIETPEQLWALDEDGDAGAREVAIDGLWLRPAMVQGEERVRRVAYSIGETLRAVYYV
jgi:hypothetical protein